MLQYWLIRIFALLPYAVGFGLLIAAFATRRRDPEGRSVAYALLGVMYLLLWSAASLIGRVASGLFVPETYGGITTSQLMLISASGYIWYFVIGLAAALAPVQLGSAPLALAPDNFRATAETDDAAGLWVRGLLWFGFYAMAYAAIMMLLNSGLFFSLFA